MIKNDRPRGIPRDGCTLSSPYYSYRTDGRVALFRNSIREKTERAIVHLDRERRIRRIGPDCFSHAFDCN